LRGGGEEEKDEVEEEIGKGSYVTKYHCTLSKELYIYCYIIVIVYV